MPQFDSLHSILGIEKNVPSLTIESEILQFQKSTGVTLPEDLKEFLRVTNNLENSYNDRLYRFFSLKSFKSIDEELKFFNGVPDYSNIINTLTEYKECYVFADYMFHMFAYAIRLKNTKSDENEIYIICGDEYKIIASSFTGFIELYQSDSIKLQFED